MTVKGKKLEVSTTEMMDHNPLVTEKAFKTETLSTVVQDTPKFNNNDLSTLATFGEGLVTGSTRNKNSLMTEKVDEKETSTLVEEKPDIRTTFGEGLVTGSTRKENSLMTE